MKCLALLLLTLTFLQSAASAVRTTGFKAAWPSLDTSVPLSDAPQSDPLTNEIQNTTKTVTNPVTTTNTVKANGTHSQHGRNKSRQHPSSGKPQARPHPGRHVCTHEETVTRPLQVVESYCKPVYKSFTQRCNNGTLCAAFRVQYDTIYRTVVKYQTTTERKLSCCPGWSQSSKHAHGCMQPVCSKGCKHGGTCIKPEVCQCPLGYTGPSCETDVDECSSSRHQCQQTCINTPGSYKCDCHDGFELQADGRSCKFQLALVPELKQMLQSYESMAHRLTQLEQSAPATTVSSPEVPLAGLLAKVEQYEATIGNMTSHIAKLEERLTQLETEAAMVKASNQTTNGVEPSGDSFQSLSEQISILEERLADCTCTSASDNRLKMNR